ncbi:MAG TPA: imidazoleglycerol-phosphate dehydratase HisB [archaeon]|nr:imidazoleglycerol-phosphate dehydratase HisB [archaeon]
MSSPRTATVERKTSETDIRLTLNLDGMGESSVATGIGFFDHMLTALARHARFDIDLTCKGDLHIDEHHSVEDVGIVVGEALRKALGDKSGIRRFSQGYAPLDEALSRVVVDLSGRGLLIFRGDLKREKVGDMSTELVEDFWRALASKAGITMHMEFLYGVNTHHLVESMFKAAALALHQATRIVPGAEEVPSTKGVL